MFRCWVCRVALAALAAAIILGTGGAGIPALGAALAGTSLAVASGVTVASSTAGVGSIAGMAIGLAIDWLCCHLFGVEGCC